ncbi:MAG TPA: GNAT family N-acetyltransferase [Thermomicrobiales bacterium]|nr:GNAT family N-acetyltransferase [Thermomicrobiales bacterium]
MDRTPGTQGTEMDLLIRPLRTDELAAADVVRRLAFGTFMGLPDPLSFRGDANPVRTRYLADPAGGFAAEMCGDLVGTNFVVDWGSVGFFGPVSVRPDLWDRGIARRLVSAVLDEFARRGTRHIGLFTFGHSPKHVALYQRFGFWPRFPTAIMRKPVGSASTQTEWSAFSELPAGRQPACLEECRKLADAVYPGLDLSRDMVATARHGFGDTVLLLDGGTLVGFAVCHCGPETEAGSGICYVKFGAVRPGSAAASTFDRLLTACEALAVAQGLARLEAGVNTARREAYRRMLESGFRTNVLGLAMDRPDKPGYDRPDVYVIDDWR